MRERERTVSLVDASFVVFAARVAKRSLSLGYKAVRKITGSLCFEATECLLLQG